MSRPATLVAVQRALLRAPDWINAAQLSRATGIGKMAVEMALLQLVRRGIAEQRETGIAGNWRAARVSS